MSTDNYADNARELLKAKCRPEQLGEPQAVKVRGPNGESNWFNIRNTQYYRMVEALTTEPGMQYAVQPHDINRLTAPMFDACGIECPAMIGADCPRVNGDGLDCPGWSAKFPSAAVEVVYGWDADERAGGGESGHPWYGLHRTPEGERCDNNPMGAGVILVEFSDGAVQLTRFGSEEELSRDWAKIVAEVEDDDDDDDEEETE